MLQINTYVKMYLNICRLMRPLSPLCLYCVLSLFRKIWILLEVINSFDFISIEMFLNKDNFSIIYIFQF